MSFGRFERRPASSPMAEINVTPLVDVMLVLVVIFILTAPLLTGALRLDLPRAQKATPSTAPAVIKLALDAQGTLHLDDQPVAPAQLAERLRQAGQVNPATEVQLKADQAVPYGRVVEVLDLAQSAGLRRIGFVASPGAQGLAAAGPGMAPGKR